MPTPYQLAPLIGQPRFFTPILAAPSEAGVPVIQMVASYKCPRPLVITGFAVSAFNPNQPPSAADELGFASFIAYVGTQADFPITPLPSGNLPNDVFARAVIPAARAQSAPHYVFCYREFLIDDIFTVHATGLVSGDAPSSPINSRVLITPIGRYLGPNSDQTQGYTAR